MRRALLALFLVVAGVGFAPAPATAASGYCTGDGADVVVDYGALGGGVAKGCGSPGKAASVFGSAGFALSYNARMGGGFVCTVNDKPADHQCTATNSYWALYIAKPGGRWVYASLGADSQPVEDGQTIAFAWQSTDSKRTPGVAPAPARAAAPSPSAAPGGHATKSGGPHHTADSSPGPRHAGESPTAGTSASSSAGISASASPSPSASPKKKHHDGAAAAIPSASTSADASGAYSSTLSVDKDDDSGGGGLPWWVPAGIVVLLGAGGGAVAWRRSRTSTVS